MKAFKIALLALMVSVASAPATSVQYLFQKDKSSLTFTATTWALTVVGTFSDWDATAKSVGPGPNDVAFTFTVKTSSFDTRNKTRDKHLRAEDFFWVDKYPEATFESTQIAQNKNENDYHVNGDLTLRGVTKPVEFDARLERDKDSYRVKGSFEVNRRDFGIVYEGSSLMPIRDAVTIRFDVQGITKP